MLAVPDGYLPQRIDKVLGRSPRSNAEAGLLTYALSWHDAPRSDMKRFGLLRIVFAIADRFPQEARARAVPKPCPTSSNPEPGTFCKACPGTARRAAR